MNRARVSSHYPDTDQVFITGVNEASMYAAHSHIHTFSSDSERKRQKNSAGSRLTFLHKTLCTYRNISFLSKRNSKDDTYDWSW